MICNAWSFIYIENRRAISLVLLGALPALYCPAHEQLLLVELGLRDRVPMAARENDAVGGLPAGHAIDANDDLRDAGFHFG
jgi:hypothetical protein